MRIMFHKNMMRLNLRSIYEVPIDYDADVKKKDDSKKKQK